MEKTKSTDMLFYDYYAEWIRIYKAGAVRDVTLRKYQMALRWIQKLMPDLKVCELDRTAYQALINRYAVDHERQTTMDFHHQIKSAVLDAVDERLIDRDPTRKVVIKGKSPITKRNKYISRYELQKLLADLDLGDNISWDWLILLIAKTGLRFSEALAITPQDFDFKRQLLNIDKTWDYKGGGGFSPTKNKSSVRKVRLDWQTVIQFFGLVHDKIPEAPIFIEHNKKVYNSTVNHILRKHCEAAGIPVITVHGLRHTHASLLLFDGVSIGSVAQRLGHASMTTTQKVYLHVIKEMENKDVDAIMRSLSSLVD